MKRKEILETIRRLAESQGFYGRLYQNLVDLREESLGKYDKFMEILEKENFKDSVDLILYFEG